ncbi:alpha beta-hydrolase [Mycena metata]|uniref:Alpha beta-hydrolase n=1 Tax=Mycena metata TaxID=1033252 RepID=A0AAD7J889_9AGAR|nr:alpha beta-hydrolase [Mycena metata]
MQGSSAVLPPSCRLYALNPTQGSVHTPNTALVCASPLTSLANMPRLNFSESVTMNLTLLRIPFFLIYVSLFGRWSKRANGRPLNRILNDETAYFVLAHLSVRQLQAVSGSTFAGYVKWTKQRKISQVVDDLENDTRLMWVGPRETEHVVLYCHGGGFVGPLSDFQVEFWYRMQQTLLKSSGMKLGVALLQYSTYPASFPTQLNQLLSAVQHIMSMGVPASKICFAGDSAGGNVVLQLVGHILHPSSLVAPQSPSPTQLSGFAGICLISPWTLPADVREVDDSFDLVPSNCLGLWRDTYLSTMPESHYPYVEPDVASQGWFDGLENIARRILITAGRNEVLCASIIRLSTAMEKAHRDVRLDVQDGGVHCDAMFDIGAKSTTPHPVEKRVADWLTETFKLFV